MTNRANRYPQSEAGDIRYRIRTGIFVDKYVVLQVAKPDEHGYVTWHDADVDEIMRYALNKTIFRRRI
jgi:hypothetical protein